MWEGVTVLVLGRVDSLKGGGWTRQPGPGYQLSLLMGNLLLCVVKQPISVSLKNDVYTTDLRFILFILKNQTF